MDEAIEHMTHHHHDFSKSPLEPTDVSVLPVKYPAGFAHGIWGDKPHVAAQVDP
jgi:hypothetical protein